MQLILSILLLTMSLALVCLSCLRIYIGKHHDKFNKDLIGEAPSAEDQIEDLIVIAVAMVLPLMLLVVHSFIEGT